MNLKDHDQGVNQNYINWKTRRKRKRERRLEAVDAEIIWPTRSEREGTLKVVDVEIIQPIRSEATRKSK